LVFSFELGAEELSVPKAGGQSSVDSPPIIDISALLDSNNKKSAIKDDVKRRIGDACRVWGFFYVVNHGISDSLLNRIQMTQNTFFKSSYDVKRSIRRVANNSRGFSDNEFTKQIQDAKEIFDVGHKPYPHLPDFAPENIVLDGYNQWPTGEGLDTFRPIVEEYYNACASLSSTLLAAIAFDMGVDPVVFERASKNHTSFLRLNFYPKNEEADADPRAKQLELDINGNAARKEVVKERLGISRHTDAGILTILQQDGVSAL
jgi:isopenicillin N synthase-like dioxygenase